MNIEKLFLYCIYFYLFATNHVVLTVRILAVFPSLSYSHYIVGEVLLEKLAENGHQITLVSPFKMKKSNENINEIRLDGMKKYLEENGVKFNYLNYADKYVIEYLTDRIYVTGETVNFTLGHPKMQELLNSDNQFDILITDLYLTDALLGLAYYYKIPSIVVSTTGINKWVNEMTGNPDNPAYIPNLSFSFIDKMNLKERIFNSLMAIFNEITYKFMYLPVQESLYKRYFAGLHTDELPPLIDLIHNVSLVLVNTHPALQYPQPFVRNVVEVGGLHIKVPKELPPDIAEFIDNAVDGVIYVNLGGSIRAADMPKDKRDAFVKTFAKLNKMRMIIKWENVTLDGQTNNVVIGPWLPQIEILAHPNVKLFITHGGILSNMEALYAGKPVIGIPIYGDQYGNVARIEDHGYGIKLYYNNITEITLMEAIQEILNNEKYQQNALKFSELFKTNMVQPLDKALYYIDNIINNKENINYFRSSAIYLNLTQTLLLDVLLIIITMIVTIIAVPSIIICIVLRCNNINNNNNNFNINNNNNNNISMKNNNNNNNNINLMKQNNNNNNLNKKLFNQKIDVNRNKKKQ